MTVTMSDKKHLALPAVGKVLEYLGLGANVAALLDPTGTSTVIAATAPVAATVIADIEDRAENGRRERMRLLLEDLRRRVERLETADDPPVELFAEIFRNAIRDDDERKIPLHGVLIEWVQTKKPDPSLVRLAMSAVAALTYLELRAFVSWYRRDAGRLRMPRPWSDTLAWTRLHQAGLISQTSTIMKGHTTEIGRILADGCPEFAFTDQEWQLLS